MAYYDSIAKRWHETTGAKGGAFKELVLNNILLQKLSGIDNCSILELGAGNGYFLPLVLRRFSGQAPSRITVTDQSERLLEIADGILGSCPGIRSWMSANLSPLTTASLTWYWAHWFSKKCMRAASEMRSTNVAGFYRAPVCC
jgi:hypothetical protein